MPLMPGATPEGFLQVAMSFDDIDRTLTSYPETLAILLPLGLGLSATGGAWVARSALRPVQTMSRTARRVTAHGGTLSVQSTRGVGSTFTIRLPLG